MRVINQISNGLVERGHNVSIIVPRGSANLRLPIKAKVINPGYAFNNHYLSAAINLPLLIFAVPKCDVIICTFSITAYFAFIAAKIKRAIPYNFIQNHESPLLDGLIGSRLALMLYRILTKISYHLPLKMLVNSRWTADMCKVKQYRIIHPCVDHRIFNSNRSNDRCSRQKKILAVGKKQPWKGLSDLLLALDTVYKKIDFKLIIISPDKIDTEYPFIEKVIKIEDDKELAQLYRQSHLFVSSSWFEGFGLPPLEAMACGTPVVLTDSGGVREYAIDGYNCLIVPPRQPKKLAQAIITVLKNDKLAAKIAKNGIETAKRFQWENTINKLERILLTDIGKKTKAADEKSSY